MHPPSSAEMCGQNENLNFSSSGGGGVLTPLPLKNTSKTAKTAVSTVFYTVGAYVSGVGSLIAPVVTDDQVIWSIQTQPGQYSDFLYCEVGGAGSPLCHTVCVYG